MSPLDAATNRIAAKWHMLKQSIKLLHCIARSGIWLRMPRTSMQELMALQNQKSVLASSCRVCSVHSTRLMPSHQLWTAVHGARQGSGCVVCTKQDKLKVARNRNSKVTGCR